MKLKWITEALNNKLLLVGSTVVLVNNEWINSTDVSDVSDQYVIINMCTVSEAYKLPAKKLIVS